MNLNFKILRKQIENQLRENLDAPLYVEYFGERGDENPFMLQDQKWQFVNAKYPDGSIDLGVYAFAGDVVYSYVSWRKMLGIDKENKPSTSVPEKIEEVDLETPIDNTNSLDGELDFTDEDINEPDYDNDAFIQDVVSGGYDVSVSQKHIGHFEDMDGSLNALKTEFNRSNFFPTIWFVSDHGNTWAVDLEGNEIKKSNNDALDEISPSLFKSAISTSQDRGTDNRTRKLGTLYFNKFIGAPLMGGKITNIIVSAPQQGTFKRLIIEIEHAFPNAPVVPDALKQEFIYYDIHGDLYEIGKSISRKDAFVLYKIASHVNPDTRYKETGKYFDIIGMNENSNKLNEDFHELNNMTKYQLDKEYKKVTDEIFTLRKKYGNFIPDEMGTLQLKQDAIYKLLYGNEPTGFKNVSKGLNEDFERNKLIASEIIRQLGGQGKLKAMTGAYNFVAIDYGVSFRIKNAKANYIKIFLNGIDLYDVEIGRIRGANYTIVNDQKDVPLENLKSHIEGITGLRLSLFEGKLSIKSLVENQFSKEEEYENKLQQLKSEGKITLTIGNHGLIFMQIINSSDFMKSYDSYSKAYEYYMDIMGDKII